MNVLVKKMSNLGLLKFQMIGGATTMGAAMILLPAGLAWLDYTLLLNPYILGTVLVGMLFFAAVGYFLFVRPYLIYRRLPEVLAETDGEFLYIHTKKEAKIPLADIEMATVYVDLPFLYHHDFWAQIVVHLFSERYGTVTLDLEGIGSFKMRFVSEAEETGDSLIGYMKNLLESESANQE